MQEQKTRKKQRFRDIKQGKVQPSQTKPAREQKPLKRPYANIASKIKAFITDSFMLLMPIMYVVFYLIMGGREGFAEHRLAGWLYILVPLIIVQSLFMIKTAQTPGYRAYELAIIDENTGEKPSAGRIILRNIYAILSFFTIIGWVMMLFRKDRKTLHDLLSHTAIIHKK